MINDYKEDCEWCEGAGEVFHASCSIPDCEHAELCPVCEGSGLAPTVYDIADLRTAYDEAIGDLFCAEAEVAAYKERIEGGHPFDLQQIESELSEVKLELERSEVRVGKLEIDKQNMQSEIDRLRVLSLKWIDNWRDNAYAKDVCVAADVAKAEVAAPPPEPVKENYHQPKETPDWWGKCKCYRPGWLGGHDDPKCEFGDSVNEYS